MARACSREPKSAGNSGRYLKVRNWASENGLSLLTRGREWLVADGEVGEQLGDELAAHGRAPVGVDRELLRPDALLAARGRDEAFRQAGPFGDRDHPAHDVAAEEVEDHIQRSSRGTGSGPSAS